MSLHKAFLVGFVRRWHTNPDLAHTCDRIDGHSGRVARIILMMHPHPSVDLIRAALIHDDGESVVGDMKAPTKNAYPVIADALAEMEYLATVDLWGHWAQSLSTQDEAWLKYADKLDAFMWAMHHAPKLIRTMEWQEDHSKLDEMAEDLGIDLLHREVMTSIYAEAHS